MFHYEFMNDELHVTSTVQTTHQDSEVNTEQSYLRHRIPSQSTRNKSCLWYIICMYDTSKFLPAVHKHLQVHCDSDIDSPPEPLHHIRS